MKSIFYSKFFRIGSLLFCVLIWLANSGNPPNGRTGAPFDGNCNDCHGGGSYNGIVTISGLPAMLDANTTYPMTITLTATSGSPDEGGFQVVAVDGSNQNAGDLTPVNGETGTNFSGGREYIEHRGGKNFAGNTVSWNFNYTSPAAAAGNAVTFYFIGNFTNGNNSTSGDIPFNSQQTFTMSAPPPLTVNITSTNVSCFGLSDGSATANPSGGAPPYSYSWSSGQTTQTINNLTAGTYTVTVSDPAGSTGTAQVTITQPPAINLSASVSGAITCANPSVTATASASGGNGGFSYNWSDGQTGSTAQFTTAGTYGVTATDVNGCTASTLVTVNSNTVPPIATISPAEDITCLTPTIVLSGAGSSQGAAFSYLWTTQDGFIIAGETTLFPTVSAAGTYVLTVTNIANGCTAQAFEVVEENITPPTISLIPGNPIGCGDSLSTICVFTGQNMDIQWIGPAGFTSMQECPTVNEPGTYVVTVTDPINGCTSTGSVEVEENFDPLDLSLAADTITCDSTTALITTTVNANASFEWEGPGGFSSTDQNPTVNATGEYTVIGTRDDNGCMDTASITVIGNNVSPDLMTEGGLLTCIVVEDTLFASSPDTTVTYEWTGPNGFSFNGPSPIVSDTGTYMVIATDPANGCTSSDDVELTENTTLPIASAITPEEITCEFPSIQLDGSASSQGTDFEYMWTTTDGSIVSGETTLTPTVDSVGGYDLLVTNTFNGCTSTTTVVVTQDPPLESAQGPIANVTCNGSSDGSAEVTASGGDENYEYIWSSGDTTQTASGLAAGMYTATVTDGNGCTSATTFEITEPEILEANASATAESSAGANDGTATADPMGGTPAYEYLWSNDSTTQTITGLVPGSYTVTVTDANNCTSVQTVTVNGFNCSINASISGTPVSCNGGSDGTADVSLTGAADPVSYMWSNGETTQNVSGLSAGVYTVMILDGNNCPAEATITISQPAELNVNASSTDETSSGANDGTASAAPTGGNMPYSYLWSNDSTTQMITGLMPGNYTVTVTDDKGCTESQTVTVVSFDCQLTANITTTDVLCNGGLDGQATISVQGAALPLVYSWSNGDTTATATDLGAGMYDVTVIDDNGCELVQSTSINEPDPLISTVSVQNVECPESTDGSATITVTGGTGPYSFNPNPVDLGVGTYTVTITDANNCTITEMFEIVSEDTTPPMIECSPGISVCEGVVVEFDPAAVTDNCSLAGNEPELIGMFPSGSVFPVGETTQHWQITDASGNTNSCSFTVIVSENPTVMLDSVMNDVDNSGQGSIDISVTGGGSYSFTWLLGMNVISTDEDPQGLMMGEYTVEVVDVNTGCSTTLGPIMVDNTVDVSEPGAQQVLRIIPNPARQAFRLEMKGLDAESIRILNLRGQLIKNLNETEWSGLIEVADLPAGMYLLQLFNKDGNVYSRKWYKLD